MTSIFHLPSGPARWSAFFLFVLNVQLGAVVPSYDPPIEAASGDAEEALDRFEFAEPFEMGLFAAEPLLANPVQLYVDDQGRVFVAETYRQGDEGGVVDNRNHMYWLEEDLAAERVEDRAAMIRRHRPEMIEAWTKNHDLVRLIEDTTGDGKADRSSIFADGFNDLLDGTGAGVIAREGKVWYTNIPNLWLLEDTTGAGYADRRESLSYGYGVTVALRGHDLHGLAFGPDGKLYFSIGDRGYHVTTQEGRQLKATKEGAVFRCNLDGSNLEVFATGLRNPQSLAFDEFGNLFTGDNNSDAGDQARWVYVVEGGDSGWRMPYQSLPDRGPFMREELWKPRFPGQAAWHIPPIANITNGPSGLAFNPGTGMPEEYDGYFFLCDFVANAARSGIWAIANEPEGAGFTLRDRHRFVWNILATDAAFGPDGSLYISDWVQSWSGVNRGRIYRLFTSDLRESHAVLQVREELREGLRNRTIPELLHRLGHPNQRLRQEAQFELARRGQEAIDPLIASLQKDDRRLARVHAIWALWQLAGSLGDAALEPLLPVLHDPDPEIRAQAARVLGDKGAGQATGALTAMLGDEEPRPAFFAAIALGRIGAPEAIDAVVQLLVRNNDRDLYLRHAAVMALTGIGRTSDDALLRFAGHEDSSVRLGILLAMRRLHDPQVALFLQDPDEFLVAEAASAIHDDPMIEAALPELAASITRTALRDERILRRAINANFRLGGLPQARGIAAFAARADAPLVMRIEALDALGDWHGPSGRDRVTGFWRPLTGRPKAWPARAVDEVLEELVASGNPVGVREAAVELISQYEIDHRGGLLFAIVQDGEEESRLRRASLRAMGALRDVPNLRKAIETAMASGSEELRREAYGLLGRLDSRAAVGVLQALLTSATATAEEKQTAILALREMNSPEADELLLSWFRKAAEDEAAVPPEILLDVIEAARQSESPKLRSAFRQFQQSREENVQAVRRELLFGGDVEFGRELVFNHQAASCVRCHGVEGRGSSDVGPDLSGIGRRLDRKDLLQSLVDPNAIVAAGYGAATLELRGGESVSGSILSEDATTVTLTTRDGDVRKIERSRIVTQHGPYSAMPPMGQILTDQELRDIVAYLATLKEGK